MALQAPDLVAANEDPQLNALRDRLREYGSVLVCYSGGVDSALVLAVAHAVLGAHAIGMTAVSPSLAEFERTAAVSVANYQRNAGDRCFFCKSELYRVSVRMQRAWGSAHIVNGTNIDDLGDYRPGLEAATQAGVKSPLVELGWSKADVRRVAALIGLGVWDKPAAACLAGQLEADLHSLGLRQVRVRLHALAATGASVEAQLARIEVGAAELERAMQLRSSISAAGRNHGFAFVTLDLEGYRMGSHNALLVGRQLKVLGQS
jgi:pyridinium-3,5-biscarboxylic acid mononucleotide sulfurtransferase